MTPTRTISDLTLACAADLAANPHAPASLRQIADLRARAERQRVTVRGSVFSRFVESLTTKKETP